MIPKIGYMGAAIAHLACYTVMMLVSYLWGQKVFPIPYQVGRIAIYCLLALILFTISNTIVEFSMMTKMIINTLMLLLFLIIVVVLEKNNPLKIK